MVRPWRPPKLQAAEIGIGNTSTAVPGHSPRLRIGSPGPPSQLGGFKGIAAPNLT